jgi:hypothetical protein
MKNVCVVYSGGLYGTFIEWCLNYFTDKNFPPQLPFTVNGSSHLYPGNLLRDMSQARQYINFRLDKPIVRVHLVTGAQSTESTITDLKHLYDNFHQLIFLYTEENTSIWGLNNKCDKIYKGFLVQDSVELKKVDAWITQGLELAELQVQVVLQVLREHQERLRLQELAVLQEHQVQAVLQVRQVLQD